MDLNLKFHKCPETKKFTKEEEKLYFPNNGEEVLCITKNNEYKILEFYFLYFSFKENKNGEMIRDGNGETIWSNNMEEYRNDKSSNEIIGWYRLYN